MGEPRVPPVKALRTGTAVGQSMIERAKQLLAPDLAKVNLPNNGVVGDARPLKGKMPSVGKPTIDVPDKYREVEQLIRAGRPLVFVSGNAGTGKTTLIHYLCDALPHRTIVVAPTGVAALNAGGVTIHSFFQFPPRMQDPGEIRLLTDRKLIGKLELLVVDEVSMLRCDVLDRMDLFLRKNRKTSEPFGGVQLLLVGDLFQLPPVVPRHEREVLEARGYASPYFFSASSFQVIPLAHVELDHIYRQEDPTFVYLLNKVRVAEDTARVLDELNRSCVGDHAEDYDVTLTCTNRKADEINESSMEAISSTEFVFHGEIEGKFRLDKERLPSPLDLRLKKGARVMFTKNDELGRWVNGTSGTVSALSEQGVQVQVGGSSGPTYDIEPVAWESHDYELDVKEDRIVARKIGEYRQYPLMLAWAVTIHKSQGKTLHRIVLDFGSGAFAPGQSYVALSRCRSLDGIRLARPLRVTDVICDPMIRRFYDALAELQE